MAEPTVSLTLAKISDPLIQQASFSLGVGDELKHLKTELTQLKWFLNDADRRLGHDNRVRKWVTETRNAAFEAEDIIDSFISKVSSKQHHHFFEKHRIRKRIKIIRDKILHIATEMDKYGVLCSNEEEDFNPFIETRKRDTEEDTIGHEDHARDLVAQLMIDDERLRVVSIVGTAGLGKTALANRVYHHQSLEHQFDCRAWVSISQHCTIKDILQTILGQLAKGRNSSYQRMKEADLAETLYHILLKNCYLVVLDNIENKETWDGLKYAFPNGRNGSKLLLTTCHREVAMYADRCSSDPFQLPSLTPDESWELFCRKMRSFPAHIFSSSTCPEEFEEIGRDMVRKCGGLPLAILVLAGLLATKRTLKEWKAVKSAVNAYFKKNRSRGGFHGVLCFVYQELPFYLKPCFLYFGLFPEHQEIQKKALVRLWVAEGFVIHPVEGKVTVEDVAEKYLQDLVNRSLVEISDPKSCCIHHHLREFCVSKANEEDFLDSKSRRISIRSNSSPENIEQKHPNVRSLLCFGDRHSKDLMEVRCGISDIKQLKLLQVLHLEDMHLHSWIPIGLLFNLRYLVLTSVNPSRSLDLPPDSIAHLKSLQTLDIRGYTAARLPPELSNLINLRHLLLPLDDNQGIVHVNFLQNLETLKYIKFKNLMRGTAMEKLTNVRSLGVMFRASEEAEFVLRSPMAQSGFLRSLKMHGDYFTKLENLSSCLSLERLKIEGRIGDGILGNLPLNLWKLSLVGLKLQDDPMVVLGKLQNLKVLKLGKDSYSGSEMVSSEKGFPVLEILILSGLEVEDWKVEEGAMLALRRLYVKELPKLKKIPEGLKTISGLKILGELA